MITQVQVGNVIYPLVEGQPLPITVGQTLRVFYQFKYKMPETSGVRIWASLYGYVYGIIARQELAQTKEMITLPKALEWSPYEGEIDINIGDVPAGIYGLICELPDYDAEEHIDDSIEVPAAPSIFEMLGPLLVLGLMAGVMSMVAPAKEGVK